MIKEQAKCEDSVTPAMYVMDRLQYLNERISLVNERYNNRLQNLMVEEGPTTDGEVKYLKDDIQLPLYFKSLNSEIDSINCKVDLLFSYLDRLGI